MRKNRAEKWAENPQKAKNRAKMNQKRAKGGRFYYRFFSTCRIFHSQVRAEVHRIRRQRYSRNAVGDGVDCSGVVWLVAFVSSVS